MKETGLSRVSKNSIIAQVQKEVEKSDLFFVTQHAGISASAIDKLRRKLGVSKTKYLVVKNRLGKIAFERIQMKEVSESFKGACGIVFGDGDPVQLSKILVDFSKENEKFKVRKGYMNGQVIGFDQVKVLANLPSREVLIAQVVGGMMSPISGLVNVLSGNLRKIVSVLDAIAKKKGSE